MPLRPARRHESSSSWCSEPATWARPRSSDSSWATTSPETTTTTVTTSTCRRQLVRPLREHRFHRRRSDAIDTSDTTIDALTSHMLPCDSKHRREARASRRTPERRHRGATLPAQRHLDWTRRGAHMVDRSGISHRSSLRAARCSSATSLVRAALRSCTVSTTHTRATSCSHFSTASVRHVRQQRRTQRIRRPSPLLLLIVIMIPQSWSCRTNVVDERTRQIILTRRRAMLSARAANGSVSCTSSCRLVNGLATQHKP